MSQRWKPHFQRFLQAEPGRLHFAAHSHHPWPDVSRAAQLLAWDDAARWADEKWDHLFGEVWPKAQAHVAKELRLPSPSTLVFAPNTHSLVLRLLSCLPERPRVLTTDSEFHSFERQLRRLEESGRAHVVRVPSEPFATFGERFVAAAKNVDLVFFSQVFFNSGAIVPELDALVRALPEGPLVVVDGYHGFCAVPIDLSKLARRAFYLGGGYKYAMAGEGVCFLHAPEGVAMRPVDTGWFAAFGALEQGSADRVPYAEDGMRFAGATFDPSGLYRFNAVMEWRTREGLSTSVAREHSHALQRRFLGALRGKLSSTPLVVEGDRRGQFLTFRTDGARAWSKALLGSRVITDARDDRLRFGFSVYQDEADVDRLLEKVAAL